MPRSFVALPALLLLACAPDAPKDTDTNTVDPGCVDEALWYADADGDGYGDASASVSACEAPDGYVADATDCDDAAAAVYPGAPEIWYDGADEDCSGGSDLDQDGDGYDRNEECDDLDPTRYPDAAIVEIWYNGADENCDGNDGDQDGDGWYAADYPYTVPERYAAFTDDCWDDPADADAWAPLNGNRAREAADVHPDATDLPYDGIDQDCAGDDDFDADVDGFRTDAWPDETGQTGEDCLDTDPSVYPGASEDWYDGIDADCAGDNDYDADQDGYDHEGGDGAVDCDDTDAYSNPGAPEVCGTPADDNCDGGVDEAGAVGCTVYYADADGDGYGASDNQCLCAASGAHTAVIGGDCDDGAATVFPGATELCDGIDEDCDGSFDNGLGTLYNDLDLDGYGDDAGGTSCTGTVSDHSDCDDGDGAIHPGATEACNAADDDCDDTIDDGLPSLYPDLDADTYGDATGSPSCAGDVSDHTDCADGDATRHPGATEICNGVDEDCDGAADDGLPSYYPDLDGDHYGSASGTASCIGTIPTNTDCDDGDATVNPGMAEVCNGADDNCNSLVDDGLGVSYVDLDGDGHGSGTAFCGTAGVALGDDCDESNAYVYPGAPELCDGLANDCLAIWSDADESGLATELGADGAWTDVTDTLSVGSKDGGAAWALSDGSSLYVCQGTWYVAITVESGATAAAIVGVHGPATTVLDGMAAGSVISTAAVRTIDLDISGVAIQNGYASSGGGIYFAGGTLTIDDAIIASNAVTTLGGGIYATNADVTITSTTIGSNSSENSGAGFASDGSSVYMDTVSVVSNAVTSTSSATAGGMSFIASTAEDLTLNNCVFENNTSSATASTSYAGGLYLYQAGTGATTLSATTFASNQAVSTSTAYPSAIGGGIFAYLTGTGATTFTDVVLSGNAAQAAYVAEGGGIYLWNQGTGAVTFTGADIQDNNTVSSTSTGAGLFVATSYAGSCTIEASTVSNNVTYGNTHAVAGDGGGLYAMLSGTTLVVDGTTFEGNEASGAAGIYASVEGSTLLSVQNDSAIQGNSGHGVFIAGYDTGSAFTLDDSRIVSNTASGLYLQTSGRGTTAAATCTGSSGTDAGIYDNAVFGVYGACNAGSTCLFQATSCDFDNPTTGTSNGGYDTFMYGLPGSWPEDATFSCDGLLCL